MWAGSHRFLTLFIGALAALNTTNGQNCTDLAIPPNGEALDPIEMEAIHFAPREPDLRTPPSLTAFAKGDLDGDGDTDFVTGRTERNRDSFVTVYLRGPASGDVSAGLPSRRVAGTILQLETTDIVVDQRPEILVRSATPASTRVTLLTATPVGQLNVVAAIELEGESAGMVAADVVDTPAPEITLALDESIVILQVEKSRLVERGRVAVGARITALTSADLDADGVPELLATDTRGVVTKASLRPGDVWDSACSTAATTPVEALATADIHQDGALDLILLTRGGVVLLAGDGRGGFVSRSLIPVTGRSLAVADLDRDGAPELVIASSRDASILVLINDGQGAYTLRQALDVAWPLQQVVVEDLDHDGNLDIVGTAADPSAVLVLHGGVEQRLAFGEPTRHVLEYMPHGGTVVDLDANGEPDIVVGTGRRAAVVVLAQRDGAFAAPTEHEAGTARIDAVAAIDADGDGDLDIVAADPTGNALVLLVNQENGKLLATSPHASPDGPRSLVVIDWDGDGEDDVIAANPGAHSLSVWRVSGTGALAGPKEYRLTGAPWSVAAHDLDGDGAVELAAAMRQQGEVQLLTRSKAGTMAQYEALRIVGEPEYLMLRDLDADGDLDLAVADSHERCVLVLENNGAGGFPSRYAHPLGRKHPTWLDTADFDGNGTIDIVAASPTSHTLSVLSGRGDARFLSPRELLTHGTPILALARDINADGDPDLVSFDHDARVVSIFENLEQTLRGDVTSDGRVGVEDARALLAFLFGDGPGPRSLRAADADANDRVNLADAIRILSHALFGNPL